MTMTKSKQYWINRADKRMELAHKNANEVVKVINASYDRAIKQLNEDILNIVNNLSKLEGMTKEEAVKLLAERVSQKTIDEIQARVKTVQDDEIKRQLMNKLSAQAYKARVTRQEALRQAVSIESAKIADTSVRATTGFFTKQIKDSYYRSMFDFSQGIGQEINFAKISSRKVKEILQNEWSGKNYSQRIWKNAQQFESNLQELLLKGVMGGKNSKELAKEMAKHAEVGKFVSERLMRTETTYIASSADLAAMKERDTKQLEFVATLDSRTSSQCQGADGKIIDVSDAKPGVNIPPLHCFCRSTVIEVMDDLKHNARIARNPETNQPIQVQPDMKYPEWHKKYVESNPKAIIQEKKIRNRSSDKKQYEKYKNTLGTETPKTLEDFQNLKYNDISSWESKKREYATISKIKTKSSYSDEYRNKLIDSYYDFKKEGYEFTDHSLNRFLGQKKGKDKVQFSKDNLLGVLGNDANFLDDNNRTVKFYNNIAAIQNNDTKEVVSIVTRGKPKEGWEKL